MGFHDLELSERRLIARRGTAFFAQRLAELTDDDLEVASLLDGWTRKHLVAHVGYNAAALCRLMDWAATGVETPMYPSAEHRDREIKEGATLSRRGLAKPVRPHRRPARREVAEPARVALGRAGAHRAGPHRAGVGDGVDADPRGVDPRRRPRQRRAVQ